MGQTDWVPGLVMLAAGLVVGLVLALRAAAASPARKGKKAGRERPRDDHVRRDLEAKRDSQVRLLLELEDTSARRDPVELARTRYELELSAAQTLRELDRLERAGRRGAAKSPAAAVAADGAPEASGDAPAAGAAGGLQARPRLQGALWGAGAVGFAVILGLLLWQFSADKPQQGGMGTRPPPMAGGQVPGPGAAPAQPDPELEAVAADARAHPQDVDKQLDLARAHLLRDQLMEAFRVSEAVLQKDPANARAMTYQAVVRVAMGQSERAAQMLDAAVAKDPTLVEAWTYRGMVRFHAGLFDEAIQSWEKALELRPDGRESLGPLLEEARAKAAEKQAPGSGLQAPGTAPAPTATPTPTPTATHSPAAGGGIAGSIVLDESLAGKLPAGAMVFLVIREEGVTSGPPSAVQRYPATSLPVEFRLGPGDTMMGLPFPAKASVEARVDSDGNPNTRSPSDPATRLEGVVAGATGVRLVLRAPQ